MYRLDLKSCLTQMGRPALEHLATRVEAPSGRELIPSIHAALMHAENLPRLIRALDAESLAVLRTLCLSPYYPFAFDEKALLADDAFQRLRTAGLVFEGREPLGNRRIVMPADLAEVALGHLVTIDAGVLAGSAVEGVENIVSMADRFRRNVITLISLAEKEPFPLTAKGDVAKTFVQRRIAPYIEITAAAGTEDRYPAGLEHALGFCRALGILAPQGPALALGPSADQFAAADEALQSEAILTFARAACGRVPTIFLVKILKALPEPIWISTEALLELLRPARISKRDAIEYRHLWLKALHMLEEIGILDAGAAGRREAIRLSFAWSSAPSSGAADRFIVTPDFKVSAPRNLKTAIRRDLSRFAQFIKSDMMDQWQIARTSVCRAVDDGMEAESMIQFLAEHSSVPLEKNITDSIRAWAKSHADVKHFDGPVVIAETPTEATRVREIIGTDGSLLGEPLPGVFLLHPRRADATLQKIRQRRSVAAVPVPRSGPAPGDLRNIVEAFARSLNLPVERRATIQILPPE